MSSSPWPGKEIKPSDEHVLLMEARLRLFGVNYLQGAVCQDLDLLAHLDGSSVLLFPLRSADGHGNADCLPTGACVCRIDLRGRRLGDCGSLDDVERRVDGNKAVPAAAGLPGLAKPFPARGVSWSPCHRSNLHKDNARGTLGVNRPEDGEGQGEITSHLAVAQGSTVSLWRVSRSIARLQASGDRGGKGWWHGGYRFLAEEVRTGWNGVISGDGEGGGADQETVAGGDDFTSIEPQRGDASQVEAAGRVQSQLLLERKRVGSRGRSGARGCVPSSGVVRCISFRPFILHTRQGSAIGGDRPGSAVPLAAWSDEGAIMLGTGSTRMVYSPPVAKKRVCGAWSGCGRRLAVSSGGEIRVYVCAGDDLRGSDRSCSGDELQRDRSHDKPPNQEPAAFETGHGAPSSRTDNGREVRESAATVGSPTVGEPPIGYGSSTAGVSRSFRTILCVETTMQENGTVSSTGSSLHKGCFLPPRGGGTASPALCAPAGGVSTNRRPKRREGGNQLANRPRLVGDMRSMCSAGTLAFFGTTDGGLGLESLFRSSGSLSAVTGDSVDVIDDSRMGAREDTLLNAALNDRAAGVGHSNSADAYLSTSILEEAETMRASPLRISPRNDWTGEENNASDGNSAGGGFRHVLPGENWLAESLRPSSGDSQARLSRGAAHPSAPVAEETPSFGDDASPPPLRSSEALNSPKAVAEVIDLRGKIGNGWLGSGTTSAESSHPLFRLGADISSGAVGIDRVGGAVNGCKFKDCTGASSGRRPWLVLISCSNTAIKSHVGNVYGREDGGGEGGCDGVELHALASLPSALSSPDLLAASNDGHFVAVGSHACGLVACYRLLPAATPFADDVSRPTGNRVDSNASELMASWDGLGRLSAGYGASRAGGKQGKVDEGVHFRQQERPVQRGKRRAVPLCTLRLPAGYRAKGLAFVNGRVREERNRSLSRGDDGHCDVDFAGVAHGGVRGEKPTGGGVPLERGQEAVLVLAACPSSKKDSDDSHATVHGRSIVDGGGMMGGESTFRTALLRFLLPTDAHTEGNVMPASSPSEAGRTPLPLIETQTPPECLARSNHNAGNFGTFGRQPELSEPSPSVLPAEPCGVTTNSPDAVREEGKTAREQDSQLSFSPGSRVDHSSSHPGREALASPHQEVSTREATASVASSVDERKGKASLHAVYGQLGPSWPLLDEKRNLPDSSISRAPDSSRSPGRNRQDASAADRTVVGLAVERGDGSSVVGFTSTQEAFCVRIEKCVKVVVEHLEKVEHELVGLSDRVKALENAVARNGGKEGKRIEAHQRR